MKGFSRQVALLLCVCVASVVLLFIFKSCFHETSMDSTWRLSDMVAPTRSHDIELPIIVETTVPDVRPDAIRLVSSPGVTRNSNVLNETEYRSAQLENDRRRLRLSAACPKVTISHPAKVVKEVQKGNYLGFIHIPSRNILFCHVPKIASTINLQTLNLVSAHHDTKEPHRVDAFSLFQDAMDVSQLTEAMLSSSTLKYLFVRDPYERLYSAYIDKFYCLNPSWYTFSERLTAIVRSSSSRTRCPNDPTFGEFIRYIVHTCSGDTTRVDPHFRPHYRTCQPCLVHYDIIGKMESFGRDFRYLLDRSNVTFLVDVMSLDSASVKRELDAVATIIDTIRAKFPNSGCTADMLIFRRQWRVLQMRGYIHKSRLFPEDAIRKKSTRMTSDEFLQLVEISRHVAPITKKEKAAVKKAWKAVAYSTIPHIDVKAIQDIFYPDFVLFDYDIQPPLLNKQSMSFGDDGGDLL